jgi:predicted ATPase
MTPKEDSLLKYYREKIDEKTQKPDTKPETKGELSVNKIINEVVSSLEQFNRIPRSSYGTLQKIKRDLSNIKYIGPIRKPAERSYITGFFKDLGFSGEHATQILAIDGDLKNKVQKSLKNMNIAEDIQIDIRKDKQRNFEFKLKSHFAERGINFKDMGCGTSQLLPIIVQSLMNKDESLVILEQPEVHLHPKTQAELADFFTDIASNDHRFLIETHSDYFIERLRYHIATGKFRSKDVILYYVDYDLAKKCSVALQFKINSEGQYVNLPDGYMLNFRLEETRNMTNVLLKNLSEKENQHKKDNK